MANNNLSALDLVQAGMILAKITDNTTLTWAQTFIPLYILIGAITIKVIYEMIKGRY